MEPTFVLRHLFISFVFSRVGIYKDQANAAVSWKRNDTLKSVMLDGESYEQV